MEFSYITGRNVKWYSHFENLIVSLKVKHTYMLWCTGKCLTTDSPKEKQACFVAFANFPGYQFDHSQFQAASDVTES